MTDSDVHSPSADQDKSIHPLPTPLVGCPAGGAETHSASHVRDSREGPGTLAESPKDPPPSQLFVIDAIRSWLASGTLIAAFLYYFGWTRTDALWRSLGIDQSVMGFSTQDYVLRSIDSVFLPAVGLAFLAVLVSNANVFISQHLESRNHWV